jgi:hypothetical protein
MLSEIIRACLVLSESDSNKPHLRSSNLLHLTVEAMKLYARNAPRLTVTRSSGVPADFGGGGSDIESAQLSVELLLQLSFCFPVETEWRAAVAQQCPDVIDVLLALKNLPADRQLDTHSILSLNHLIGALGIASQAPVPHPSSTAAATKQHVMLSYCWGAKKELVVELGASLRAKGVDVWRDEEGSQCVPAMSGSTDDCMAAAIEHSHTIIVCVSRAYKASANCRMEAKYANDMHKRGKVNLVFAMMEQDYTTRSSPEYVDGWLGLMVGDQLWHGMWAHDQVAAVAAAIHFNIRATFPDVPEAMKTTETASLLAMHPPLSSAPAPASALAPAPAAAPPATLLPMQPPQPLEPPAPSSRFLEHPAVPRVFPVQRASLPSIPSRPPASTHMQMSFNHDNHSAAALTAAFACLQDASKARDTAALEALLQSLGAACAADLAFINDADILNIKALLKPTAANFFAVTVGASFYSANDLKNESFSYLLDASKHTDEAAMSALLQHLGISQPHELQFVDDSQLRSIVALLKPVAAKVFLHMMEFVCRRRL